MLGKRDSNSNNGAIYKYWNNTKVTNGQMFKGSVKWQRRKHGPQTVISPYGIKLQLSVLSENRKHKQKILTR